MTIQIDQYTDPFTFHVYNQIDPSIRATFTPTQVTAIENAIRANRPYQRHSVDLRGVIPLYFLRLYFVLLLGRDKRQQTRNKEQFRRQQAKLGSALLSFYVIICMMLPFLFLIVYFLKAHAGVDFIPGWHLHDLWSE